jgi:hypothetical protein
MNVVRIPVSERAAKRFRTLPKQEQNVLASKVTAMLEQELAQLETTSGNLTDFQDAMGMTNRDMILTFGEAYLTEKNWKPAHD